MNLVLVGLNHRTAPVAIRERYAVAPGDLVGLDEKLAREPAVREAAVVSTCNRTELLAAGPDAAPLRESLVRFLHDQVGDASAGSGQIYELGDRQTIEHLFSVAASLDSMVLGEAQILGQLKDAYRAAVAARSLGPLLNRLFQHAFRASKRVRSETGLGTSTVSVARVGVQLARQIFAGFESKRVMLLGAGEMAEAALHGLRDAGARDLVLVNRTFETARALAHRFGGRARSLDELESELAHADVVISSVQVERPILGRERLAAALRDRHGRPTLIIDLGVPRNIEEGADELANLYVYDLDDLEQAAERGRAGRASAVPAARALVSREVDAYERWRATLPLVPTIRALHERIRAQVETELGRAGGGSATERRRSAEAITARILHRPLERLKREAGEGGGAYYAEAAARLFALDEEDEH